MCIVNYTSSWTDAERLEIYGARNKNGSKYKVLSLICGQLYLCKYIVRVYHKLIYTCTTYVVIPMAKTHCLTRVFYERVS